MGHARVCRLSRRDIQQLVAQDMGLSSDATDEMAIPTHTHFNPLIRWLFWRRYEVIAELAELRPTSSVLDFGCGIGVFLPTLCQQAGSVFAMDLFPQYAELLAERRRLNVTFVDEMSALVDDSLDLIIAADVLEHIAELDELLSGMRAKLQPAGRLIISGPTENLVYKLGRVVAGFAGKGDYHVTNVAGLCTAISACGFTLQRSRSLPLPLPPHLFRIHEFSVDDG